MLLPSSFLFLYYKTCRFWWAGCWWLLGSLPPPFSIGLSSLPAHLLTAFILNNIVTGSANPHSTDPVPTPPSPLTGSCQQGGCRGPAPACFSLCPAGCLPAYFQLTKLSGPLHRGRSAPQGTSQEGHGAPFLVLVPCSRQPLRGRAPLLLRWETLQ